MWLFVSVVLKVFVSFFVLLFSLFIHEYGHFKAAQLVKLPVKDKGIGLGPVLTTIKGWKIHLFPVIAYVNVDLSNARYYQKVITALAGPVSNLLLGVLLLFSVSFFIRPDTVVYPVNNPPFQAGDEILKIANIKIPTLMSVPDLLCRDAIKKYANNIPVTIRREGKIKKIVMTHQMINQFCEREKKNNISALYVVSTVPGEKKLKSGDKIVACLVKQSWYPPFYCFPKAGVYKIQRKDKIFTMFLDENVLKNTLIDYTGNLAAAKVSIHNADLKNNIHITMNYIKEVNKGVKQVISQPQAGSFRSIISAFVLLVNSLTPVAFLLMFAVLNLSLGLVNLIPIPALDGGHVVWGWINNSLYYKYIEKGFLYLLLAVSLIIFVVDIARLIFVE